jgi:NADPH:quinone reductase-like Zn-dependent oxidoreductase
MKAVVLTGTGGPEKMVVEERPEPLPGPGEVRVVVRAAGVNFAELLARRGLYPDAPGPPCVLGYEYAGDVDLLGDGVEGLEAGMPVFGPVMFGGQAEMVVVPREQAVPLPDGFGYSEAAALPVNYCTAIAALIVLGGLREGQRVLIHAAAGGVGTAAVQIARDVGAEIFGTASAGKHEAIRLLGVEHAIDYRNSDFEQEVLDRTNGEGVDLVIDATGPTAFRKDYRLLRDGGRLVMFGVSELEGSRGFLSPAGIRALLKMPLATAPWWKSLAVIGENKSVGGLNLLDWWKREGLGRLAGLLDDYLERGAIDPVIAREFSFSEAGEAHRYIEERRNIGKVLLTP